MWLLQSLHPTIERGTSPIQKEEEEMGVMEIIYEQDSDNRLCLEESAERSSL